jgi:trk system potassium uptake protein TrkA
MKIAIVGAGKLGTKVAKALMDGDNSVTMVDTNESKLQKASSQMDIMTVNANAKEIRSLRAMGISSYDFLITTTASDEMNIIIAAFAKNEKAVMAPGFGSLLDFMSLNCSVCFLPSLVTICTNSLPKSGLYSTPVILKMCVPSEIGVKLPVILIISCLL